MSKKALGSTSGHITPTFDAIVIGTSQTITTSGTSQPSLAFAATASIIRVYCTQDCFIAIGTNPTASTSTLFLPAGFIEYFAVSGSDKIAVIQSTISGNFYVTEGA